MAEVTENETEIASDPRDDPPTWWGKWKVPAVPVIVGMLILTAGVAFALWQQHSDREATAAALRRSTCETQVEFRAFMTDYLADQIGVPIDEATGFAELPPDLQNLAISLGPILDAQRQADQEALGEYMSKFPIPDCSQI